ncbi:hypothetical protein Cgig2_017555 [Carnegiea gigantea]|uniref:BZIP domain-containing protein n=1 Tax=Carnegiea gigantea TaxID=171969 RepID=A0A9Q1QKH3_9CARY|nr:hypothetical protein Cgig2_017555 [Carnegiea gigantea]
MASSKVMPSTSNSRSSDISHHPHNHPSSSSSPMISDFSPNSDPIFHNVYGDNQAMLDSGIRRQNSSHRKTVDDLWREIVGQRKECKLEAPDEMMTLEDFLAKAEEADGENEFQDSKLQLPLMAAERLGGAGSGGVFGFDPSVGQSPYAPPSGVVESGVELVGGRGKRRAGPFLETLDKAAQQRQRRMIKNRESAAMSRERKQAYQFELESLAAKLKEENEKLLRQKGVLQSVGQMCCLPMCSVLCLFPELYSMGFLQLLVFENLPWNRIMQSGQSKDTNSPIVPIGHGYSWTSLEWRRAGLAPVNANQTLLLLAGNQARPRCLWAALLAGDTAWAAQALGKENWSTHGYLMFSFLQLMEKLVPVVEKRKPSRMLRRVRSMQW